MSNLESIVIDPKTFLHKHCTLPALPEIITQIQEIMYSPDIKITDLANIINKDPALVAQVLKIVNSAYYSLPIEITEVKHAVAYIGINEIHRIVLSLSVIITLSIEDKDEFNKIWFHSLLTAHCTKYITKKFEPNLNLSELWSMALLHDIGKFVYLKFFPDHFKELSKDTLEKGCLFSEAEIHFSYPSSSYFGALLCDRWRLSEKIKNACSFHSLTDLKRINKEEQVNFYVKMVILGNLMAILAVNKLEKEVKEDIINEIIQSLHIGQDEFWLIMADVSELKEKANTLLHQLK